MVSEKKTKVKQQQTHKKTTFPELHTNFDGHDVVGVSGGHFADALLHPVCGRVVVESAGDSARAQTAVPRSVKTCSKAEYCVDANCPLTEATSASAS